MGEKRIIDYSDPLQEAYRQASEELKVVTDELDRLYAIEVRKAREEAEQKSKQVKQ